MRTISVLLLVSTLLVAHSMSHEGHKCGYEYLRKIGRVTDNHTQVADYKPIINKRNLQSGVKNWHAFRMIYSYTRVDQFVTDYPSTASLINLSKRVLTRVSNYLKAFMQVNFYDSVNVNAFSCNGRSYTAFSGAFDYAVMVVPENNTNTTYFAAASPCLNDDVSRPVVGEYFLNVAYMSSNKIDEYIYFSTFLHEATHLLGFSNYYYTQYRKANGVAYTAAEILKTQTLGGKNYTVLALPNLVTLARTYFNCTTLLGAPLENDGGSGSAASHWEKLYMPNEYMNPTIENDAAISDFTLTLLNSTGWYRVDFAGATNYLWGKNGGCSMFTPACPTVAGYCSTSGVQGCSTDFSTKTVCQNINTFVGTCIQKRETNNLCDLYLTNDTRPKNAQETYGPTSRCIEWVSSNTVYPMCHKITCLAGNVARITFETGQTYDCNVSGKTFAISSTITLRCPDPVALCSYTNNKCPDDCYNYGNGMCMKNLQCYCFYGKNTSTGKCNVDPAMGP